MILVILFVPSEEEHREALSCLTSLDGCTRQAKRRWIPTDFCTLPLRSLILFEMYMPLPNDCSNLLHIQNKHRCLKSFKEQRGNLKKAGVKSKVRAQP